MKSKTIYGLVALAIVIVLIVVALTVGVVTISQNIMGFNIVLKKNGTIGDYIESKNKDIGSSVSYTPFARTNPNPSATVNGNPTPVGPKTKIENILNSTSSGLAPHNS